MHGRFLVLASMVLVAVATPIAADQDPDEITAQCTVDVGAPFVLVDLDDDGDEGPAIGGCLLVHGTEERYRLVATALGDWFATLYVQDCLLQVDEGGDGSGFRPVDLGDEIPAGSNLWATCETGERLDNEATLEPT